MLMYNTIIHPIRKALLLSVNEYCVLDTIMKNQAQKKFDYWCVMTNDYLAEELDLSKRTIQTIKKTLEVKGYLERGYGSQCRVVDNVVELFLNSQEVKFLKMKDAKNYFASGKVQNLHRGEETAPLGVKKLHPKGEETAPYTKRDTDKDTNKKTSKKEDVKTTTLNDVTLTTEQLKKQDEQLSNLFKRWTATTGEAFTMREQRKIEAAFYGRTTQEQNKAVNNVDAYFKQTSPQYRTSLFNYLQKANFNKTQNLEQYEKPTKRAVKY